MKNKMRKFFFGAADFIIRLTGDNVSVYAAQASFFFIISVIPFLMLVFTIMKMFIDIDEQYILHTINSVAPAEISDFATIIFNELFDKTSSISVISITAVTALWLSSRGIMALLTGLNNVYHLPQGNYFYRRFLSVIYTAIFVAALLFTILFFGFGRWAERFLESQSAALSHIMQFLLKGKIIVFFVYLTLIFALCYRFLPKTGRSFKEMIPGAAFAAVGWLIFTYIYSIYIKNFSGYTYVYGSLAAVVFLMLWLYFCMNIFLYGAQINKMIKSSFFSK